MSDARTSSSTKRAALRCLLVDGEQSVKIVVEPELLGGPKEHGFPRMILDRFSDGIPLDLNPSWPLDLDLDGDPQAFYVSLSFEGKVYRCSIPWRAISVIGVGFGGIGWEHEEPLPEEPQVSHSIAGDSAESRSGHLRVVK